MAPSASSPHPSSALSPAFVITIDTEGDNAWARAQEVTTRNAEFLLRFQRLCESYKFKPTYLTNYEMAIDGTFIALGRDALCRGTAEIGMHLHAWHSPPAAPLTDKDFAHCPYLIDYSEPVMRAKIGYMTELLTDTFQVPITSHRAGRWAIDERYAQLLIEHGYRVDCSVTPGVSWRHCSGAPSGIGGADYTHFPEHAYWLDPSAIAQAGSSSLLELPMTIMASKLQEQMPGAYRLGPISRLINRVQPARRWLRPDGRNLHTMLGVVEQALQERRPYIEFMLHSSELMPGGSPSFPTVHDVERLYTHLEQLFTRIAGRFRGRTLSEYATELSLAESG